jgi:septum formation protein
VSFTVRASRAPELERGKPAAVTVENALRKARAVRRPQAREAVLGCDTVVALDGEIYGKPPDAASAHEILRILSGRTHEVISGLALLLPEDHRAAIIRSSTDAQIEQQIGQFTAVARTEVTFRTLQDGLLDWYLATGEWRERAGGYAIQGAGAALVRAVAGDYENVVGLPLATLLDLYPQLLEGDRPAARGSRSQ